MLEIIYLDPHELTPYENNTRRHNPTDIDGIKRSIERVGFRDPIGIWGKNNLIVEGHGRQIAAIEMGLDKVPCIRLDDMTDEQRKEYAIRHNRSAELSSWDFEKLEEEIAALEIMGVDVSDLEFKLDEMPSLGTDIPTVTEDEAPEPPEEPKAKRGDLYQLGEHRLMCGDSTCREDVETLMDGKKAELLLTDPPYGMTAVQWDSMIDLGKMWEAIQLVTNSKTAKLLFSAQPFTTRLIESNEESFRYEIIWVKTQKTGFYNANRMPLKMHENICVFYDSLPTYNPQKERVERNDIGRKRIKKADRCVLYGHVEAQDYIEDGTRYPGDVIGFSNWNGALFGNTDNATVHPTQKPVELLCYLIETYSNSGEIVLDIFGGSGSTLIACEQLGRKCFIMELEPKYVDVIIQRWEDLTGKKAVLLNG